MESEFASHYLCWRASNQHAAEHWARTRSPRDAEDYAREAAPAITAIAQEVREPVVGSQHLWAHDGARENGLSTTRSGKRSDAASMQCQLS